jgi:hypothetical protein
VGGFMETLEVKKMSEDWEEEWEEEEDEED